MVASFYFIKGIFLITIEPQILTMHNIRQLVYFKFETNIIKNEKKMFNFFKHQFLIFFQLTAIFF